MVCEYRYGPKAMEYLKNMPDITYSKWRNFVRKKFRKKNGGELAHAGKVAYYAWRKLNRDLKLSFGEKDPVSFEFKESQFKDIKKIDEKTEENFKEIGREIYDEPPKNVMQFETSTKPLLMIFEESYKTPRMVIVKKKGLFSKEEVLTSKIYRYLGATVFDVIDRKNMIFIEWLDGMDCEALKKLSTEKDALNYIYYLGKTAADAHCIGLGDRLHNERVNLLILKSDVVEEFKDDVFSPVYNVDYEFAFMKAKLRRTPEEDLVSVRLTFKKVGLENISDDIIKTKLKDLIDTYIEGFSRRYKNLQENYRINKEKIDNLLVEYDQEVLELCKRRFNSDADLLTEKLKEILISAFLS
ncbi:MAG: hypothetical protein KAX04_01970 [Methanomicrobia archaeon]|nr:hypothetical protein [Methanomicrobia archaeon]